jgi:hypothetical protein
VKAQAFCVATEAHAFGARAVCIDGSSHRADEETAMKRTILCIATTTCLLLASAFAVAAEHQSLATVDVQGSSQSDCTPPNDRAVCAAWHEEIRRNFTSRQIGMLFGAATSYPEYRTSYSKVKARYDRLQGEFAANHAVATGTLAAR